MTSTAWSETDVERLDHCPLCGSPRRTLRYAGIDDWFSGAPGTWDYHECHDCGALYIDPRPTPATIGRLYEHYFTHVANAERARGWLGRLALGIRNDYVNQRYGHHRDPAVPGGRWLMYLLPPWFRWEWDHWARHLPIPAHGSNRLLDVGCGNGAFLAAARDAGWDAQGIDFDPKAVETARAQGLDVAQGGLAEQGFPDEYFDAITVSHVIEHVHDPIALVRECIRILKHRGRLWIATPNADAIYHLRFQQNWFALNPQHLILFRPANLRQLLESSGLRVSFLRRGLHAQSHWCASAARKAGLKGFEQICLPAFQGAKVQIRYQFIELLVTLRKRWQGDLVVQGLKES